MRHKTFILLLIFTLFSSSILFAQGISLPQSPPIDIELTANTSLQANGQVEIRVKVTPQEDMHAQISCLLPKEAKLLKEKGVMLSLYHDKYGYNQQRQSQYRYAARLWVGPLEKGKTKEFVFHINISNGRYEFITVIDALAKWGTKEKSLVVDLK